MKSHLLPLLAATALTAGCATSTGQPAAGPEANTRGAQVGQAVVTPLSDLNLVRGDIPPVLLAALKSPYGMPADRDCATLAKDIQALDAVLGADLDTPASASNPSLIDRGGDAAVGAFRNTTEGIVPFRGWIRKLSGAEKYSREVAAAIAAGTVRRAYLKGLGLAAACPPPAAPRS